MEEVTLLYAFPELFIIRMFPLISRIIFHSVSCDKTLVYRQPLRLHLITARNWGLLGKMGSDKVCQG
jgi:hypothetical protein